MSNVLKQTLKFKTNFICCSRRKFEFGQYSAVRWLFKFQLQLQLSPLISNNRQGEMKKVRARKSWYTNYSAFNGRSQSFVTIRIVNAQLSGKKRSKHGHAIFVHLRLFLIKLKLRMPSGRIALKEVPLFIILTRNILSDFFS